MDNNSKQSGRCPRCGANLDARSPGDLCPKCLMLRAAEFTEVAPGTRAEAPPLEQVASAFPNLEIIELIGQGGMGCVYKARQPQLNRLVALKVLPQNLARDPAFEARFAREAQALAVLNHPNIVTIHDFGHVGGFYYLLMEFVDGVNLRQAIRAGRFTPEQALAVIPPVCDALQFAHDRGVVHRDIKPENLLLDKSGRVKIADFGIAKMVWGEPAGPDTGATHRTALGTPRYMAPEQVTTPAQVDHRADIYSLGVVLYELLTGELPRSPIEPPSRKVQIDVRLDEVVLRALQQSPELRWQTAADLRTGVQNASVPAAVPSKTERKAPLLAGSSRESQLALWLFLAGTLGTLLLMTLSHRHELALAFGGVALLLALFFGFASRRERLGRIVALFILAGLGIPLLLMAGMFFVRKYFANDSLRQMQAQVLREQAALERMAAEQREHLLRQPRQVVTVWLSQLIIGREDQMLPLTTGAIGGVDATGYWNLANLEQIRVETVAIKPSSAIALSNLHSNRHGSPQRILFKLVRQRSRWLIDDHQLLQPEAAERMLNEFTNSEKLWIDGPDGIVLSK